MTRGASQKLLSILKCARPVLFQNDNEEWPLSIGGTAFVVRFRGRYFVLTAKHVLRNFDFTQFRVQYHPNGNHFLPLSAIYTLRAVSPEQSKGDDDQYDIAVWTTDEQHLDAAAFQDAEPYGLLAMDKHTIYNPNAAYLFCGYPAQGQNYDPDARHMHQMAVSGRAEYIERTNYECLHRVRLILDEQLDNLDGLSGSPVFQVNNDVGRSSREAFAGMLVRGTRQNALAYFLEHRRIVELMEHVYARPRHEQGTQPV